MAKGEEANFPEKNSYKGLHSKKILAQAIGQKNILGCPKTPQHPLPHHFSNGPSLTDQLTPRSPPLNLNTIISQSITRIDLKA